MIFIIMIALIIYFVLIAWTWQSLGFIEKNKKVVFIIVGIIIMYAITWIIYQITKVGVEYPNEEMKNSIQNILVAIFTGINGMIVMPQIGKMLDKINEDEMEKQEFTKKLIILMIVFVISIIIEIGYMKDTQQGIVKIYHTMQ